MYEFLRETSTFFLLFLVILFTMKIKGNVNLKKDQLIEIHEKYPKDRGHQKFFGGIRQCGLLHLK
jgi:hypothetical protein